MKFFKIGFKLVLLLALFQVSNTGFAQTTYTSNGNGTSFTDPNNWTPASPVPDFATGIDSYIVNGHNYIVDGDIVIDELTVTGNGTVTIGNDINSRDVEVQGDLTVDNGSSLLTDNLNNATHILNCKNDIVNNGTIDLFENTARATSLIWDAQPSGTVSWTGTPTLNQLANLTFLDGGGARTFNVQVSLDVEANLTVDNNSTFNGNGLTHTLSGNWAENGNGSYNAGGGTLDFDASLVQTISTDATFENVIFSGGGVVTTNGDLTITGDFTVSNSTAFNTGNSHDIAGDFDVSGGVFDANAGRITFNGNTSPTTLDLSGSVQFDEVHFEPSIAVTYNITGNLLANDETRIFPLATVSGSGDHTLEALRMDGICNFSGSITFTGGLVYDRVDNLISLGTASILINGGGVTLEAGDALTIDNDFTINSGTFTLDENAGLDASLNSSGGAGVLLVQAGANLAIQGADAFPTGFATVTFSDATSRAQYANNSLDQTIRGGITYGELELGTSGTKTADGNIIILGDLDLNNGITFDKGAFDLTVGDDIQNGQNATLTSSGGTTLMNAPDDDQTIGDSGSGSYTFNNLTFSNTAPTAVRTKNIDSDITILNDLTITNTGGSASNFLIVDVDANVITGGNSFSLDPFVQWRTSGANNFPQTFASTSLDINSTVRFDGGNQTLPGGITYGNVELSGNGNKTPSGPLDIDGFVDRIANTPLFTDAGLSHNIAGDWLMAQAYTNNMTGTMIFDGVDQIISQSNFNNVTYTGGGTKTLSGNHDISGALLIDPGTTVDGVNYIINIAGNWTSNGSFSQITTGEVIFDGTVNQNLIASATTAFNDLTISNNGTADVVAMSNVSVVRDFDLVRNRGEFDLDVYTLEVGRNFENRSGTSFLSDAANAIVSMNGDIQQEFNNDNPATIFPSLEFSGSGEKRLLDNGFNIDGNVTINGSTLDGGGFSHTLAGDWTNTGAYQATGRLTLDGTNQTISSSTFHDLYFDGSDTKLLAGNIILDGDLQIEDGVTVDVSGSDFNISVEEDWMNTGTGIFVPQMGTVTFTGGYSRIFSGTTSGPAAGKGFYNVNISNTTSRVELDGDLDVDGDLVIATDSELELDGFDVFVEGSFLNGGTLDHNSNNSLITFDGTSGVHQIQSGGSLFRQVAFNAPTSTYQLQDEITFTQANNLDIITLIDGTFDLNGNNVNLSVGQTQDINISGGILEVDAGAALRLGRDTDITNSGGTFRIVGTSADPAVVNSRDADTGDYFEYIQTGGNIEAGNYSISNTTNNGFDIQGGTIDGSTTGNNFSSGSFNNGAGNAYLTIDIDFISTITRTVFNEDGSGNPNFNVSAPVDRTPNLNITFDISVGSLAGEGNDNDPFNQINWTFGTGSKVWDGGGLDSDWNNGANWLPDGVPLNTDIVLLDHSQVPGAYNVDINATADGVAETLVINAEGNDDIELRLDAGFELDVEELIVIADGTLSQLDPTSVIRIAGGWSNSGTFNEGTSTVIFDATSGVNTINTGGASDSFYNLEINGSGGQFNVQNNINISNDINISDGQLSVIGNRVITVQGNWNGSGGVFDPGTGRVEFNSGGTQEVTNGTFYDLTISAGTTVNLLSNVSISDDLTLSSGTLNAAGFIVFIADDWVNNSGPASFVSTGAGTVILNGGGGQTIGGSQTTTFNNLFFSGTGGNKLVSTSINVDGDMNIITGPGTVRIQSAATVTGSGTGTLSQSGSQLWIQGASNFPSGFGTIDLSAGQVHYRADINQDIFPTTYFDLVVARLTGGVMTTKSLTGNIVVNDDITINDVDTELDANDFTIDLFDALTVPTGGRAIVWGTPGGTGTLRHLGGNWGIDADISNFNNLILSGTTSTKTMNSTLSIDGDVLVDNGINLNMNGFTMTGTGTKIFSMAGNGRVTTGNILSPNPAFPDAFGTYSLATTSVTRLNATTGDQTVYTIPTYGTLILDGTGNKELSGNLDIDGDLDMGTSANIDDDDGSGPYNINVVGDVDIRNFIASSGTTFTLDGADQTISSGVGGGDGDDTIDEIRFNNLTASGTGTKTFPDNDDDIYISGNMLIDATVNLNTDIDWFHSGATWTNFGSFSHTTRTVRFISSANSITIDPGASNSFSNLIFDGADAGNNHTITTNGLNIDGGVTQINNAANIDFGTLTHNLAFTEITSSGNPSTISSASANAVFDRAGGQTIRIDFTWNNVQFSGSGDKDLPVDFDVNDVVIDNGVRVDMSDNSNAPFGNFDVRGNWNNAGTFVDRTSTVTFVLNTNTDKVIDNNGSNFYNVTFRNEDCFMYSRNYTMLSSFRIAEDLNIGCGATFITNGFNLSLGDNDGGNPDAEQHTIEGTLTVSPGSILGFDCTDTGAGGTGIRDPQLYVNSGGTLNIVGVSGNISIVERIGGNERIDIQILSGGTVNARFYDFSDLSDNGLIVNNGALVGQSSASDNFSDGVWSDIATAGSGGPYYYLVLDANVADMGSSTISNVTFNHGGSPQVGVHFNVRRDASGAVVGVITFDGTINGLLAGATYEDDADSKIDWPVLSQTTWLGTISTDWFDPGNWDFGVPTVSIDAIVPIQSNNPFISSPAVAQNLIITNGIVTLGTSGELLTAEDITVGLGNEAGILAVADPTAPITIAGGFAVGNNGIFINGDGTLTFNASIGSVTIQPRNSTLFNVNVNGAATFLVQGTDIDIDGSVSVQDGTLIWNSNNYNVAIAGDYSTSGSGTVNASINGVITLDGDAQSISEVNFDQLTVSGTGVKTFDGTINIADDLIVASTLNAGTSTIDMNGDVLIEVGGTFNDGNTTHTFSGPTWTGNGSYVGSGTIEFDRTNVQDIFGGQFHSIDFNGTNEKRLQGNVDVTGDVIVRSSVATFRGNTYLIDNTSGTGTFTLEAGTDYYVLGADNYPSGFATYAPDPTSLSRFEGTSDQTIRGGVTYGRLFLQNPNTKTLSGDIIIEGDLDINSSTLDVSANNYQIEIKGDFDNDDQGSFIARSGDVILDGTGEQRIQIGTVGNKEFYNLFINKPSDFARHTTNSMVVRNNFVVFAGTFRIEDGNDIVTVGGDLLNVGGVIETRGTFIMNQASGTGLISANGSAFNNLEINSGGEIIAQDNIAVNNLFTLTAGTFNGDGNTISLGGGFDVIDIAGTYIAGAGGRLELGNSATLNVQSGGGIQLVGMAGNPVVVTNRGAGNYNFNVDGNIQSLYTIFRFMGSNGISVNPTGTIDLTNNFSYSSFENGVAGGTLLRIENTQDLVGGNQIVGASFPTNAGGGAFNVSKFTSSSGNIEFFDASGSFAGADYENDPFDLIDWLGQEVFTWTAGAATTDWEDPDNWSSSLGGNCCIPSSNTDAIIPTGLVIYPIIDGLESSSPETQTLEIESGASLQLSTNDSDFNKIDLRIYGDLELDGFLSSVGVDDYIQVNGSWDRAGTGLFSAGTSKIDFSPVSTATIDNGSSAFYILEINSGIVSLGNDLSVDNDLNIAASSTLDVTTNDYDVEVGAVFDNNGTFTSQDGLLTLNATAAGNINFNPGTSSLNLLTVNANVGTRYLLQSTLSTNNNVDIEEGILDLNANTFNMGDGVGVENLTIEANGQVEVDANADLRMGSNSGIVVNSGGTITISGTNESNVGRVESQSGRYSFQVISGGAFNASFFTIEDLNTNGLTLASGANLVAMDDGNFVNGAGGGRYLRVENEFSSDPFQVSNIDFGAGATTNVSRPAGVSDVLEFVEATGPLAGEDFDDDPDDKVLWTNSNLKTWDGSISTVWNVDDNWTPSGIPTSSSDIIIPDVANDPILDAGADGLGASVLIQTGAELTLDNSINLDIEGSFINSGTFNHTSGTVSAAGQWTNLGTINSNENSFVSLDAPSGIILITAGGSSFGNLTLDSDDAGDGTAIFRTVEPLSIQKDFIIDDGDFEVTDASHNITLNSTSDARFQVSSGGTYTNSGETVSVSTTANGFFQVDGTADFFDVALTASGSFTLSGDIDIDNDLTLNASPSQLGASSTIDVAGDFVNNGTFTGGSMSTVSMIGAALQTIENSGAQLRFYNLVINNSFGVQPQVILDGNVEVGDGTNGNLNLTDGIVGTSASNMLLVSSNSTPLTGGTTSASYVDGPMQKSGTVDFTFPVGDGAIFARIAVETFTGNTTFQAQYFDTPAPSNTTTSPGPPPLEYASNVEYWDLQRLSGTGAPLVELYWENGTRSDIQDISDLVVAHFTGGAWNNMGGGAFQTGSLPAGSVRSTTAFTSFSPVSFGSESGLNALPVELIDFTASPNENVVDVEWATGSEINNDYFTVQRSKNGVEFEDLQDIEGSGNSNQVIEYEFVDERPYSGISYYRLKQTDFDGTESLSKIVSVFMEDTPEILDASVYPNPFRDSFRLTISGCNEYELVSVFMTDNYGKVIDRYTTEANSSGVVNIEVRDTEVLSNGVYILNVVTEKGNIQEKVIKY